MVTPAVAAQRRCCSLWPAGSIPDWRRRRRSRPPRRRSPPPQTPPPPPPQKQALAPLSADWETLERQRKLKWLEVANRYPGMKPEEQQRSQERMREWTRLTPEQRRVARDTYARVQTLPPEKRAELLEKYQNLPEEKKRQLEAESKSTKSLTPVKPPSKQLPPQPTPNNAQIRQGVALGMPKPPAPSAGAVPVQPAPATSVPEDAAPVSADNTPAKS